MKVFLLKAILPFGPFSGKSINTAVFLLSYVNQELLNLFQLCSIHGQNIVAQQMSGDGPVQVWGWVVRSLFYFSRHGFNTPEVNESVMCDLCLTVQSYS